MKVVVVVCTSHVLKPGHGICTTYLDKYDLAYFVYTLVYALTTFNEEAYLTLKAIFHKAIVLFQFDCETTLKSSAGTSSKQ